MIKLKKTSARNEEIQKNYWGSKFVIIGLKGKF